MMAKDRSHPPFSVTVIGVPSDSASRFFSFTDGAATTLGLKHEVAFRLIWAAIRFSGFRYDLFLSESETTLLY